MATVPADVQGPSDAELIDSVRAGAVDAYGQLYERHVSAAYNLARQLARSSAEADDLVSDAFAKVLDALRAGRGPDSAFRAYLLTALRHTAYDKTRREKKVDLAEDVAEVAPEATSVPFRDTAVAGLERSLAARAFARLPERWQTVLWHTEIEGQSPAEVAPLLGLTANGVSALAYRAREGLKQAYLQVHLAETQAERCRATVDRLGAWTRGGLSRRETTQVEAHLDECADCRALAAELADVNGALRAFVAPLVLGLGAGGYLAATAATAKAATAVAAAAGTGGAAGALGSAPRQLLGVAASAAALVVAVAVGLASGGDQQVPAAQTSPPPPTTTARVQPPAPPPATPEPPAQEPPAQEPPAEDPPAQEPPAQEPPVQEPPVREPPAQNPPAPTTTPPTSQPPTSRPPDPEPEPEPTPPLLVPTVPSGFTLTPGSPPVDLPVKVRNTGETASQPANAALHLPPGVHAVGPGAAFAGPGPARLDSAADQTVPCPAGEGDITCTTERGIEPGEAATFVFRLRADPEAVTGPITGTVSAGVAISVGIRVDMAIQPADDAVDLRVHQWHPGHWDPRLDITATNTGGRAGVLRLVVEADRDVVLVMLRPDCVLGPHRVVCERELARGESFRLPVWAIGMPFRHGHVTVTATLGDASQSVRVPVGHHMPDNPVPELPAPGPDDPTRFPVTTTPTPPPVKRTTPGTVEPPAGTPGTKAPTTSSPQLTTTNPTTTRGTSPPTAPSTTPSTTPPTTTTSPTGTGPPCRSHTTQAHPGTHDRPCRTP
ncbi:sigma-70 family RNA polymerase sigma factor [Saccharothrix obliqua]|uniref:sigma-70 family RNA polymerase sigma factor n=1 Tax=Saccharothrix obliqua TaxID=2861747 RepID=UPI001C5D61B8|nr:sigma-70 family RNA polymerase sigma factor [Saccharothrix obliqua]MBW4716201.1 sigma-70 family RNA polymerase sigma factor [Saccharothrix obliqua]